MDAKYKDFRDWLWQSQDAAKRKRFSARAKLNGEGDLASLDTFQALAIAKAREEAFRSVIEMFDVINEKQIKEKTP